VGLMATSFATLFDYPFVSPHAGDTESTAHLGLMPTNSLMFARPLQFAPAPSLRHSPSVIMLSNVHRLLRYGQASRPYAAALLSLARVILLGLGSLVILWLCKNVRSL
jgi:hypothetical protein